MPSAKTKSVYRPYSENREWGMGNGEWGMGNGEEDFHYFVVNSRSWQSNLSSSCYGWRLFKNAFINKTILSKKLMFKPIGECHVC
jgi:hypothetical protein